MAVPEEGVLFKERKGAVLEKDVAFLRILFKFNTKKL